MKVCVVQVQKISTWYTSTVAALGLLLPQCRDLLFKPEELWFNTKNLWLSYVPVPWNAWKEDVEEGNEGKYGLGVVVLVRSSRTWSCRTRYGLHNGMLPETIRAKLREQDWIPTELLTLPFVHFFTENWVFVVHGLLAIWGTFFVVSGLGEKCRDKFVI